MNISLSGYEPKRNYVLVVTGLVTPDLPQMMLRGRTDNSRELNHVLALHSQRRTGSTRTNYNGDLFRVYTLGEDGRVTSPDYWSHFGEALKGYDLTYATSETRTRVRPSVSGAILCDYRNRRRVERLLGDNIKRLVDLNGRGVSALYWKGKPKRKFPRVESHTMQLASGKTVAIALDDIRRVRGSFQTDEDLPNPEDVNVQRVREALGVN